LSDVDQNQRVPLVLEASGGCALVLPVHSQVDMKASPYSRKQLWRRQTRSNSRDEEHNWLYAQGVADSGTLLPSRSLRDGLDVVPTRAQSLPTIGGTFLRVTGLGHVWATMPNFSTGDDGRFGSSSSSSSSASSSSSSSSSSSKACASRRRRQTTFAGTVRVVLIPARNEYQDQGLAEGLWWEDSDYTQVPPVPHMLIPVACRPHRFSSLPHSL